jgi:CHAT domain-containing protein
MQYASDQDTPVDRCESFVWLARAAGRAVRPDLSREAVQRARSELGAVTDAAMKARLDAQLSLAEAHLDLEGNPVAAIAAASRAALRLEAMDKQNQLVECYLVRGKARERHGELGSALSDYVLGLRTAEGQRARVGDLALRITFFDTVFELGRSLVRLELERGNSTRALLFADRVRATTMPEKPTWDVLSDADEDGSRLLRLLPPDGAVVFFSLLDEGTAVWVLRRDAIRPLWLDATADVVRREVRAWRDAVARRDEQRADDLTLRLFTRLVAPLRPLLDDTRTVVIVPEGILHLVSWGSLRDPTTGRRWIEEVSVGVAPSLRSLLPRKTGRGAAAHDGRATLVGDVEFDSRLFPDLPPLPATAREIEELQEIYPRALVLRGEAATAARVLQAAVQSDILHVAAHAIVHPTDPNGSALVLAPEGSAAADGRLTAERIRSCDLRNLDLVVLAACRTGDGPMSASEGPLGLARAFLAAGARAVVVSLWDVPDEAARRWSVALHRHLKRGLPVPAAMKRVAVDCWNGPQPSMETCGAMQLVAAGP